MSSEYRILGGRLHDGIRFVGTRDVIVQADRIIAIEPAGSVGRGSGVVFDASGLVVSPGFIDGHANSTPQQIIESDGASALHQGVTTQIVGHCGRSGDFYTQPEEALGHLDVYREVRGAVNIGTLIGHSTIRQVTMQGHHNRIATAEEIGKMVSLARAAFDEHGAMGISTGFMYAPGSFASDDEIVTLLSEAGLRGLVYSSHLRDEGDAVIESVEEAIHHARSAGVRLQIAHHKIVGYRNVGKSDQTLDLIREARQEHKIDLDVYPYTASSTLLRTVMPQSVLSTYGFDTRAIREDTDAVQCIEQDGLQRYCPNRWGDVVISATKIEALRGRSIGEITGTDDPVLTMLALLDQDPGCYAVFRNAISQDDLENVLLDDRCAIASDGYLYDSSFKDVTHPRSYGSFPLSIERFVNERGSLSLERMLQKMTSLPAEQYAIKDRGVLRPGAYADIVIFDPERLQSHALYDHPTALSSGVSAVFVNGKPALLDGKVTGARSGVHLSW